MQTTKNDYITADETRILNDDTLTEEQRRNIKAFYELQRRLKEYEEEKKIKAGKKRRLRTLHKRIITYQEKTAAMIKEYFTLLYEDENYKTDAFITSRSRQKFIWKLEEKHGRIKRR